MDPAVMVHTPCSELPCRRWIWTSLNFCLTLHYQLQALSCPSVHLGYQLRSDGEVLECWTAPAAAMAVVFLCGIVHSVLSKFITRFIVNTGELGLLPTDPPAPELLYCIRTEPHVSEAIIYPGDAFVCEHSHSPSSVLPLCGR